MPISIYTDSDESEELAWLCSGSWDLSEQVLEFERWLDCYQPSEDEVTPIIVDIGFLPRIDATGGGPVFTPGMMRKMSGFQMTLHLSEHGILLDEPGIAKLNDCLSIVDKWVADRNVSDK